MTSNNQNHQTMRAVVWEGKPYSVAVKDMPLPTIQLPEDAIVRVTSAAICGSDLHVYHGLVGSAHAPWIMGHEAVGVITEIGPATEQFKVGDRVLVPGGHALGHLDVESRIIPEVKIFGFGRDFGDDGGCLAEYVRVPFADDSLVAIPDNYSSDLDWLFLSDIFATGWTGLDYAGFESGDSVAIFGTGPVGLMCAYTAKLRGASRIYCIDHVRERLDKAASLGAIPIDFTSSEGIASVQLLRREPRGVKRVVDCVGQFCVNHRLRPQQNYVLQEAIEVASVNGGIGLVGVYASGRQSEGTPNAELLDPELLVSAPKIWLKRLSLRGGSVDSDYFKVLPRLVNLVTAGKTDLDFIVSSQMNIEDAPEAFDRFDKKLETKVVFRFPTDTQNAPRSIPGNIEHRVSKLPLSKRI